MLKVLFIDIDGTIRINKKINPKIITSLKELKNLGVKVILSTGRNFLHARKVARYLGTYPLLITCNGSLVKRMDNNETIKNGKIPRATIRKVFKITSSLDCKLLAHEANNNYYIRKNDDISPDIVGMTITSKDYDTMLTLPETFKKKIPEIEVVNSSKALYLGEKISRKIYFHDLNLKGLTKGFGVRTTFNYLGETSDEAIAIGDSNNDISMMSLVKTSVATQNATPDLKKNCNTVLTESLELYLQKLVEELQTKGKKLMKLKQKVDMTIDAILIIIGMVMLILPTFKVTNIKHLFFTIMLLYAILNFIQFILTRKSKDYEGLYTTIISLGIAITGLFFSFEDPLELAISLLSWTTLMGVAKLIKASYYNDKRDRMYKLRIFTLIAFLILGFLTSINLYYDAEIQVVVLGFFFYTHGILELIDPLVKYLLK